MAGANGFVVWAETIKQAPAERTQPAGFLPMDTRMPRSRE